ncbi:type II toxin-antitoxin system RelE/ParE family toxin [Sphingomonas sp. IC-56]|nr:type II toxin-antitoxin system RelE/ParE family toxin [Sphingomonas sp. IC-56]MCD2323657.1 type II toxin-antitoxin system RelE/ParE family toxin [Sphingomonas sp. IC-56]
MRRDAEAELDGTGARRPPPDQRLAYREPHRQLRGTNREEDPGARCLSRKLPYGGRPGKDGIRVLRVHDTPLLILYRLPDGNTVDVLRVRHEREDWLIER